MNAVHQRILGARANNRKGNVGLVEKIVPNDLPFKLVAPSCRPSSTPPDGDVDDGQRRHILARLLSKRQQFAEQPVEKPQEISPRGSIGSSVRRSTADSFDCSEVEEVLKLSTLMHQQEWDNVHFNLFDETEDGLKPRQGLSAMIHFEGEKGITILHALCRYQPPLDLVEDAAEVWPFLFSQRENAMRHTPLHVACQFGSRSDVVKFLLNNYGEAALLPDIHGRLPLHLSCRPIRFTGEEVDLDSGDGEDFEEDLWIHAGSAVIGALCKYAPETTQVEDQNKCNALELALDRGLSHKICQLLLDTSNQVWKAKKEKGILEEEALHRVESDATKGIHNIRRRGSSVGNLEVMSMPGAFSYAAAQEHLRNLSSRNLQASDESVSPDASTYEALSRSMPIPLDHLPDEDDEVFARSMPLPLKNLPPYEVMLKQYIAHMKKNGMIMETESSEESAPVEDKDLGGTSRCRRRGSQVSPNVALDQVINGRSVQKILQKNFCQEQVPSKPTEVKTMAPQESQLLAPRRRRGSQIDFIPPAVSPLITSYKTQPKKIDICFDKPLPASPARQTSLGPASLDSSWHSSSVGSSASNSLHRHFHTNRSLDLSLHSSSSTSTFSMKGNPYVSLLDQDPPQEDVKEEVIFEVEDSLPALVRRCSLGRAA